MGPAHRVRIGRLLGTRRAERRHLCDHAGAGERQRDGRSGVVVARGLARPGAQGSPRGLSFGALGRRPGALRRAFLHGHDQHPRGTPQPRPLDGRRFALRRGLHLPGGDGEPWAGLALHARHWPTAGLPGDQHRGRAGPRAALGAEAGGGAVGRGARERLFPGAPGGDRRGWAQGAGRGGGQAR